MAKLSHHTDNNGPGRKRRSGRLRAIGGALACAAIAALCFAFAFGPAEGGSSEKPSVRDAVASASAAPMPPVPVETADSAPGVSKPARTPSGEPIPESMVSAVAAEHEEGVVLVQLAPGFSAAELTAAIDASGCTVPQTITEEDVAAGFAELAVADGYDVAHATAQLSMLPETAGAQPNYIYHLAGDGVEGGAGALAAALPNLALTASPTAGERLRAQLAQIDDPYASKQWALDSIGAYEAWETTRVDGSVTVAVVDNGCLVDHEDLVDNIVAAYNAVDGSSNVTAPYGAHGTHVCGIVAATANNGKGIAGVSYNAGLLPIQAFSTSSIAHSSTVAKAYSYIMENAERYNIKVVNMSLGVKVSGTSPESVRLDDEDKLLIQSVNDAYDAGILTVCSSGNEASGGGAYLNYPSDWLGSALSVIALQNGEPPTRAPYSNYNLPGQATKDISAPGGYYDYAAKDQNTGRIYSTTSSSAASYDWLHGTSMAAPCVAGVAALVYAANPALTAGEVSEVLCNSAVDLGEEGWDEGYGVGEVNAASAVRAVEAFLDGEASLVVGNSTQLTPMVHGEASTDAWEWSSSNPTVATVSDTGVVTGAVVGTATITASSQGMMLTKVVHVYDASFDGGHAVPAGCSVSISFDGGTDTDAWSIGSADESVAIASARADGRVDVYGVAEGTTTVVATLIADPKVQVSHEIFVEHVDFGSEALAMTWSALDNIVYTGSAIKPIPQSIVYTFANGATLDVSAICPHEIAYEANIDAGTAKAIVRGTGSCSGEAVREFAIHPASIESASLKAVPDQTYTGSAIEPDPTLVFGSAVLEKGKDYELSFSSNENVGTATFTVTGMGNFSGMLTGSFTIVAKSVTPTILLSKSSFAYNGERQRPKVAVKDGTVELAASDYTVSWPKGCKNAGTYEVVVSLRGNYAGSGSATFKITRASLAKASVSGVPKYAYYTGKAIKPAIKVEVGSKVLKAGTDYKVAYAGNRKVGTAKITITGKGNYKGSLKKTFKIIRKPSYKGATKMQVSSKVTWQLSHCTLRVLSGSRIISVSGATVKAKRVGTAKLGIYNDAGVRVAKKTIRVRAKS